MRSRTVSVARSFDETTIQPPTRCYHPESHYESKSQYSHKTNDVRKNIDSYHIICYIIQGKIQTLIFLSYFIHDFYQ